MASNFSYTVNLNLLIFPFALKINTVHLQLLLAVQLTNNSFNLYEDVNLFEINFSLWSKAISVKCIFNHL